MENNLKEYTNEEIIKQVNKILENSEYNDFDLLYILKVKVESENCYAVASKGDEIIGFNPFKNEIDNIPEWDYAADNDIFQELELNRKIIYMTNDCHYGIWNEINNYYPEDIEYKEGMQKYLKYCKKHNITIDKIHRISKNNDLPDVMQYLEKKPKLKDKGDR